MAAQSKSPPLFIWGAVLLITGGIIFFLSSILINDSRDSLRLVNFNHNLRDLKTTYLPDPEACQVIAWGSSLTRQGIDNRREFRRDISNRSQQNIEVQKMIITDGSPEILPAYDGLFKATEDYAPDLLLIEDYLLFFTGRKQSRNNGRRSQNLARQLYLATKRTNIIGFDLADQNLRKSNLGDTINFPLEYRQLINLNDYEELLKRIKKISDLGIPIVVIDLPRPAQIQKMIKGAEMQLQIDELVHSLNGAGIPITYWKYPHHMPFRFFADFNWHMSEIGMKTYSSWLSGKIIEQLAGQCQR